MIKMKQITFKSSNKNLLANPGIAFNAEVINEEQLQFNLMSSHIRIRAPKNSQFFLNKKPYPIKIDESGQFELNTNNNVWISNIRSDFNTLVNYNNIVIEVFFEEE